MKRLSSLLILACVMLPALAWAQSGFNGTWVMDTHSVKSTSPQVMLLQDGTYWCKSCDPAYHVKADGKFHKVAGQSRFDMEAVQVVDAHTVKFTRKKDGKLVGVETTTVVPDGQTAQVSVRFTSQGHPVKADFSAAREVAGPRGAHAISGTWRLQRYARVSKDLRTMTLAIRDHELHMSSPVEKPMTVKLDGTDTPIPEAPKSTLSATMPSTTTLREERKKNGKLVSVATYTLAPDGKSIHLVSRNVKDGSEFSGTMIRQ